MFFLKIILSLHYRILVFKSTFSFKSIHWEVHPWYLELLYCVQNPIKKKLDAFKFLVYFYRGMHLKMQYKFMKIERQKKIYLHLWLLFRLEWWQPVLHQWPYHLPQMNGPSIKCVLYKTFLFFIRIYWNLVKL